MTENTVFTNWKNASDELDDLYSAKENGEDISNKQITDAVLKVVETTRARRKSEGRRYQ